jgi:hypothetical protein
LRRLRLISSTHTLNDSEIQGIYTFINRYLQDEDAAKKVLSCFPGCREPGIAVIAQGLFSTSTEVQRITTEIMRKMEKSVIGR